MDAPSAVDALPVAVLRHMLEFLDHEELHAVERSAAALRALVRDEELWRTAAQRRVVSDPALSASADWKKMLCLAHRRASGDAKLLRGIQSYSSADRQSETPANTLTYSRCWAEMCQLKDASVLRSDEQHAAPLGMTLGERIQYKCGCSTGRSCYWSSSASTDKHATEFIDYAVAGPSVVRAVQLLPYRVFWHPGSPTYAPEKVRFEFYEGSKSESTEAGTTAKPPTCPPFYASPDYDVQNEMTLQEFVLPAEVMATESTTLRMVLIGRHQAQTFELPQWLRRSPSDDLPKYYCCLSYVNVVGLPWRPVDPPALDFTEFLAKNLANCSTAMSFTEYMSLCYQELVGRLSE